MAARPLNGWKLLLASSVREYVFYVFFQISKNLTFYVFFKMSYQKVVKSHEEV